MAKTKAFIFAILSVLLAISSAVSIGHDFQYETAPSQLTMNQPFSLWNILSSLFDGSCLDSYINPPASELVTKIDFTLEDEQVVRLSLVEPPLGTASQSNVYDVSEPQYAGVVVAKVYSLHRGLPTAVADKYRTVGEYYGMANDALLIKKQPGVVFQATAVYQAARNDEQKVAVVKAHFISKIMKTVEEYFCRYKLVNNDYTAKNYLCTETSAGIEKCTAVDWDGASAPLGMPIACEGDTSPALRASLGMEVCNTFLFNLRIAGADDSTRKQYCEDILHA